MKELITAVNAVMAEAKSISKNSNVGTGRSSYKGVKDIDVKALLQPLMQKNQLAIFQTGMEVITEHEVWEQDYNGQAQRKKQVFTEVKSKYLLMHSSGQSIELAGLGHGIDSQDKGAGKAQTYALKMVLIYTFLVPVGDIDDTDTTHSNEYEVPAKKQYQDDDSIPKVWLTEGQFKNAIASGKQKETLLHFDGKTVRKDSNGNDVKFIMKKEYRTELTNSLNS